MGAGTTKPDAPGGRETEVDLAAHVTRAPSLPESIGPYRIIQVIGEGGMGVVYKAEQREPVRRVVALKVIKLGMDTKEVLARFDAERQALALMSHPNVAKVFEAGFTDGGRPYFAMEYVPGVSITHYCDTQKLTTRERLDLFIPVCQAVQHAHQKGVIHRDLKPGNILITLFDGKPVPKVIDFGVAKATSIQLTDKTLFTHSGSVIGTLEYMSPEQATGSGLDVDTRTDVYSLGVILYQLLTGSLPFEPETLRKAGPGQVARIIQDTDPPKPSVRLTESRRVSTGGRTPDSTEIARRHRTDPHTLRREIEGDLDWIVLKAMEKDRTRRYETASALAGDIRRHLDDEPVTARPPSTGYRVGKFARRHRVGVAAAVAITAALVIGLAAATYGLARASRDRDKALAATELAQRAAAVAQQKQLEADRAAGRIERISGLVEVLAKFRTDASRKSARQTLDDVTRDIDAGRLSDDPVAEARIRGMIGRSYASVGFNRPAANQFRRVVDIERSFRDPGDRASRATHLNELAETLLTVGETEQAERCAREARELEREKTVRQDQELVATTADLLGGALADQGKWAEAEPLIQEAFEYRRRTTAESRGLAASLAHRAEVLLHHDAKSAEGARLNEEARAMLDRVYSNLPAGAELGPVRRMVRSAARRKDWVAAAGLYPDRTPASEIEFLGERAEVLTDLLGSRAGDPVTLRFLGATHGRLGEFDAACSELLQAHRLGAADPEVLHQLLALLVKTGQVELFRSLRGTAMERFKAGGNEQAVPKTAMCLSFSAEEKPALRLVADHLLAKRPRDSFSQQTAGIAAYRAGDWLKATQCLIKSRDHAYAYRDALNDFYLAMAWTQLGDPTKAKAALDEGAGIWEKELPKPRVEDLEHFEDWIMCEQARAECEAVMKGGG